MQEKDSDVRLLVQTADSFHKDKFKTSCISVFRKTQIFFKGADSLLKLTVQTWWSLHIPLWSSDNKSLFCDSDADLLMVTINSELSDHFQFSACEYFQ